MFTGRRRTALALGTLGVFGEMGYGHELSSGGVLPKRTCGVRKFGMTPITDAERSINPATTRFWSSRDMLLLGGYAGGANLTRARFSTPWRLANSLRPINGQILPGSNPGVASWLDFPLHIPATHEFIMDANQSGGAASDVIGLVFLTAEGLTRPPVGETLTLRGDVSGAIPTARVWTEVTVNWEYALPPGDYAIVGSECFSTNGIAHRWMLETSAWRPGGLSQASVTGLPSAFQMNGALGVWGVFTSPVMPRLEVLGNAIEGSHTGTVFLQVVAL